MIASRNCLDLIKKYEGFRAKPYLCPADVPTIGYGNTTYLDGRKVTLSDPPISERRAEFMLSLTVGKFAQQVDELGLCLNQNQFDAVVSFCYNVGVGAFKSSTLLKRIKSNVCDPDISYQFSRWNKSNGKVLQGLVKRRKEEAELYFT